MTNTRIRGITLVLMILLTPSYAWAINLEFLKYDPVHYFTEEDWRIAGEAFDKAMDSNPDGVPSSWENPESGSSGTITPLDTYRNADELLCRTATIRNRARHLEDEYRFQFCKDADGVWKHAPKVRAQ